MDVRVLGPIEAWHGGRQVAFARRQQRLILGILALEPNQLLLGDRLIDLVWGERPPNQARAIMQSRISEVRSALALAQKEHGDCNLETHGAGYILRIPKENVDAHAFKGLVERARDVSNRDDARKLLRSALELWRGPALGGWLPEHATAALAEALESTRLSAAEELFEVELALGRHHEIADEILGLLKSDPTRERLLGQLMIAQFRAGRPSVALRAYEEWRQRLADELGTDPGQEVQAIHLGILRGELPPDLSPMYDKATVAGTLNAKPAETDRFIPAVPRLLPALAGDFVGRSDQFTLIKSVLADGTRAYRRVAISGPGGVGKTTLCVEVGHDLLDEFPDGQLFIDLHGADSQPVGTMDLLARLLRALGVDGPSVPPTLDARAELYRSLLSDKRFLIILDNAASDDQVLPLIPGGAGCGLIVNSRSRIGAMLGAVTIGLDVLAPGEAGLLLERVAGTNVVASPTDWLALGSYCGHLPLALRIVGAKLASKPHWGVAKLLQILADERARLDHLKHGNLDIRTCISLSYSGLQGSAQDLLRRIGDMNFREVTVELSAALLDCDLSSAEDALECLFDAQLVDVVGADLADRPRYRIHDLIRLFAQDRATEDHVDDLEQARDRVFQTVVSLLDLAHQALLGGQHLNIVGNVARLALDAELEAAVRADPLQWFDSMRTLVADLVSRANRDGQDEACWELACTASPLFECLRLFEDLRMVLTVALHAVQGADNVRGTAAITYRLGGAHLDIGELDIALRYYKDASSFFVSAQDLHGAAIVTVCRASVERFQGDAATASRSYASGLDTFRALADESGIAFALRGLGQVALDAKQYADAHTHLEASLRLYDRLGSRQGAAQLRFWLGMLYLQEDQCHEAEALFYEALSRCRTLGDKAGEVQCLRGLGLSYQQQGDEPRAAETFYEALRLARQPVPTMLEEHIRRAIAGLRPS